MMRCASRNLNLWFGTEEGGGLDQLAIAGMLVLGIGVIVRRPAAWGGVISNTPLLFLFHAYLFVSVLWSGGALENPLVKVLRPLGDLVMALIVVSEPNPRLAILTMARRTAILLIPLSVVLIRYFPDLGRAPAKNDLGRAPAKNWAPDSWVGVTTHKNPLGQLCLLGALAFLWCLYEARVAGEWIRRQRVVWIYLAMLLYLFWGGRHSRSSTAIICLLIAVGVFWLLGRMRTRVYSIGRRLVGASALALVMAGVMILAGTSPQAMVADLQGKDATLSDRTYLWQDVARIGMRHPWFGSGYGAFWIPAIYDELSPEVNNHPAQAHNGYLETFANLGIVGVAILLLGIAQAFATGLRMLPEDFEYGRLRLVIMGTVLILNYTEASFPRGTHLWWFGFLIVALQATPWVYWPQSWTRDRVAVAPESNLVPA
jgi:O-antigen ligase